ncbi:hypothetical protein MHYP_G00336640 [Metynnis hypsauchen]
MGSSAVWVFLSLEMIIAVACCLGNVLVIRAVWICGALSQPTFCFIVSLAVTDFLVGSVAIPIAVLVDIGMNISFYGCLFMCCVMIMLEVASVAFLLAVAVDRFLRVRIPLTRGCKSVSGDIAANHAAKLADVERKLPAATDKIDDLENRSRWYNICIEDLPEGAEGSNTISCFKTCLPELVKVSLKGVSVKLDSCHRALTHHPMQGQWPWSVIVKILNFQDKVLIMQAARKAQGLSYKCSSVSIYEDFSAFGD